MTTYLVATTTKPDIICPDWCDTNTEEHVAELRDWDGEVVHSGWFTDSATGFEVVVGRSLTCDGKPVEHASGNLVIRFQDYFGREMTLAEAENVVKLIKRAMKAARKEATR